MTRRMFSDEVTQTDSFLDLPTPTQLLYFHLGMNADDDGFISSPRMVMRVIRAGEDDLKLLFAKKFLLPFENGVCVVKHWRINNYIRKDIYKPTKYLREKKSLYIRENGAYTFNSENSMQVPDGHFTVPESTEKVLTSTLRARNVHLGKVRLGKDNKESKENSKKTYGEFGNVKLTPEEYEKLIQRMGEQNTKIMIIELDTGIESKGYKYKSHYATILTWARKRIQDHQNQPTKNKNAF